MLLQAWACTLGRSQHPTLPPFHDPLHSLFFHKEMELSLIGLQNAGKSSLVNVLTTGSFHEDMIPTVGGWVGGWVGGSAAACGCRGGAVRRRCSCRGGGGGGALIAWGHVGGCPADARSPPKVLVRCHRVTPTRTSPHVTTLQQQPQPPHNAQVGFNMRKVTKGAVTIKMWDLGGQPRFRSLWERYCRGVQAIVYVVDAADHAGVDAAAKVGGGKLVEQVVMLVSVGREVTLDCAAQQTVLLCGLWLLPFLTPQTTHPLTHHHHHHRHPQELNSLLERPSLDGIPLLVLGNKNDLPGALTTNALIERMELGVSAEGGGALALGA